jgi:hypothetical protein
MFYITKSKLLFRDFRSLSLSWIMAWPFGSTNDKPMAPWVSENYVAYYQVCKSHTSIVCKSLIRKGSASVANDLKLLLSVWHRLLSVVMQPKTPSNADIAMVGELAKVYLTRYIMNWKNSWNVRWKIGIYKTHHATLWCWYCHRCATSLIMC